MITAISRDWGSSPSIVRITSDDSLATITTAGYLVGDAVAESIRLLQNGDFEWLDGDLVAIVYDGGEGFFTRDAGTNAFVAETNPGSLSETLQQNRVFVGSAANVATGVAMSGDVAIVSAGTTTIQPDVVTSDKIAPTVMKHVRVPVTAAQLNGAYAAPFELIAAPGADLQIWVQRAALHVDYGGTPFADGGAIALQLNATANGAGVLVSEALAAADLIAQTADGSVYLQGVQDWADDADTVNEGLYLSNLTGAFTGGTNTVFALDIWYAVVSYA